MRVSTFIDLIKTSTDTQEIYHAGVKLAQSLGCDPLDLGRELGITLYCNDASLCESLGLLTDDDLDSDVEEIVAKTGGEYWAVRQALHDEAIYGIFECFYTSGPTFVI